MLSTGPGTSSQEAARDPGGLGTISKAGFRRLSVGFCIRPRLRLHKNVQNAREVRTAF